MLLWPIRGLECVGRPSSFGVGTCLWRHSVCVIKLKCLVFWEEESKNLKLETRAGRPNNVAGRTEAVATRDWQEYRTIRLTVLFGGKRAV